jgi:hypothetical protein
VTWHRYRTCIFFVIWWIEFWTYVAIFIWVTNIYFNIIIQIPIQIWSINNYILLFISKIRSRLYSINRINWHLNIKVVAYIIIKWTQYKISIIKGNIIISLSTNIKIEFRVIIFISLSSYRIFTIFLNTNR